MYNDFVQIKEMIFSITFIAIKLVKVLSSGRFTIKLVLYVLLPLHGWKVKTGEGRDGWDVCSVI